MSAPRQQMAVTPHCVLALGAALEARSLSSSQREGLVQSVPWDKAERTWRLIPGNPLHKSINLALMLRIYLVGKGNKTELNTHTHNFLNKSVKMSYEVNIPRSWTHFGLSFTVIWINIIIVEELAWKHNGQENKAGNNCRNILFWGGLAELWVAGEGREK